MALEDLAAEVLEKEGRPLHYRTITKRIVEGGRWPGGAAGKTPWFSLYRGITEEVRNNPKPRFSFERGRGIVHLTKWEHDAIARAPNSMEGDSAGSDIAGGMTDILESGNGPPTSISAIAELLDEHHHGLEQALLRRLAAMSPYQFESFAGRLLEALGFSRVEVTKKSGDGGIDGTGRLEMGVVSVNAAFQVKRWQGKVPRPEIDKFRGAIQGDYDQGIFVTTSSFTEEAKQASVRRGSVSIVMIDGQKLIEVMIEKGLGVRTEPLTIERLDDGFFSEFE